MTAPDALGPGIQEAAGRAPFALELVWDKIGPIIEEWQRTADDLGIWENVAWLGKRYQVWYDTRRRSKLQADRNDAVTPASYSDR